MLSDAASAGDSDPAAGTEQEQAASGSVAASELVDSSAEELALRREAERLARLKQEADRLESERRAAQKALAEQRRARLALEQKARLERKKIVESQQAMEKMASERVRAEQELKAVVLETESLNRREAPKDAITVEKDRQIPVVELSEVASHEPLRVGPASAPETVLTSVNSVNKEAVVAETAEISTEPEQFLSNPCNGPTARFMSTCF